MEQVAGNGAVQAGNEEAAEPSALSVLAGYAADVAFREGWTLTIFKAYLSYVHVRFDGYGSLGRASSFRLVNVAAPATSPRSYFRSEIDALAAEFHEFMAEDAERMKRNASKNWETTP